MHFDANRSVARLDDVRRVLVNARVLGDLPADARIRVADEMSGCVVTALLHGATLSDLRADLHSLLTVAYDVDVTAGGCEQLARELYKFIAPPAQRW